MIRNNYYTENEDIQEYVNNIIDWEEAVHAFEGEDFRDAKKYAETGDENLAMAPSDVAGAVEYYKAILESMGELAGKELAQVSQEMDHIGLKLENGKVTFPEPMIKAYNQMLEAGLQPYSLGRHHGGLGLPAVAQTVLMELLARGDASMAIAFGCANIGEVIERFASPEIAEKYIPQLTAGTLTCAMALTEPNHGSDLPNVQTRAAQDENGVWKLTGTKRFITHACGFGDTPAIILTLARTGAPTSGARGLSFFIGKSEDIEVAGIEHKMGLHCSPTCEIVYDDSPGILIGEVGEGLVKGAMGMMNSARISIAAQSMGIAAAAQYEAHKYANEREQFGKLIKEIPAVRKMLDKMDRECDAMRNIMLEAGRSIDKYAWRAERLKHDGKSEREIRKDEQVRHWDKMASLFTPLAKYYISEGCNEVAYDAIQIHGGSGYTEEYDVARIYRDARITTIYEGTTQLQVVACIGHIVSGMTDKGILKAYIDGELAKFAPSSELLEVKDAFEKIVDEYKGIKDGDTRDEIAFEVVEAAARFINGMLMERSTSRAPGDSREKRNRWNLAYNIDSLAMLRANLVKVESKAARQPVTA